MNCKFCKKIIDPKENKSSIVTSGQIVYAHTYCGYPKINCFHCKKPFSSEEVKKDIVIKEKIEVTHMSCYKNCKEANK